MLSSSDCKVLVPLLDWNTLECIELCARSFPFEGEKLHICTSVHLFCVFGGAFYFPCPHVHILYPSHVRLAGELSPGQLLVLFFWGVCPTQFQRHGGFLRIFISSPGFSGFWQRHVYLFIFAQ